MEVTLGKDGYIVKHLYWAKQKNENKSSACTEMMDIAHYFRYIEV